MESYDWVFSAFANGEILTAFDVETTGLNSRKDSIVEIGAVCFNKEGEINRFSTLVNPGIPMPKEASKVNNITDKMLYGQPSIQEVLPAFLNFTGDSIIIAHNAPFDCGFINAGLSRLYDDGYSQISVMPNRIGDTLIMARRLLPGSRRHNLQELASYTGLHILEAHRAFDDARLCMELFTIMFNYWQC